MEASSSGEIISIISTVLNTTSNSYSELIQSFEIFAAVVTVLFTGNFLFNALISQKKINKDIDEKIQEAKNELKKEVEDNISKNIKTVSDEIMEETEVKIKKIECEVYRNLALASSQAKLKHIEIRWWFKSVKTAIEVDKQDSIGRGVHAIDEVLKRIAEEEIKFDEDDFPADYYLEKVKEIPGYLNIEKSSIKKSLLKIKKTLKK